MNISNYQPHQPPAPISTVITSLFRDRVHKKISIDRSDFGPAQPLQLNQLRREYSQISQRSSYSEPGEQEDATLSQSTAELEPRLKHRLIKKSMRKGTSMRISQQLHKKYNNYLVNFLHKSNLCLIKAGTPPELSVLETIDEGDFILNDSGTEFERKDYPHYSNVIPVHQIEPERKDFFFINEPQKIKAEDLYFQIEDNCVLKLKQIYHFVGCLFKRSIQFAKKMRSIKSVGGTRENQNHDFQMISQDLGIHYRTTKLMYDILNEFYGFEREMIKGDEGKTKAMNEIKQSLKGLLQNYKTNDAIHIPHGELYISLRQLRQILHAEVIANESQ